ncbi:chloramphenicol-sensitive protein RarD [Sphingobium sp. B1D7B]|uniref:EamA family transporter RarD n=1 Tax=Sphingobium sp. B1D7B TaxID=2940578 RepID=UPI0022258DDD|nr:EamA family transporter RarD [Sphingobium sp. B1D7B]MCW2403524.1 chloramphenicol-sensitive protein RarD [Sphingobium sp. B1D7B]
MSSQPTDIADAEQAAQRRAGLLAGVGAYAIWGLMPLYFKLLGHVSPFEIVAHRVIWSVAFLAIVLAAMLQYRAFVAIFSQPRILAALALSAVLIGINWLVYIWAVDTDHVVAASLGYFLNPLVNVLLGTLVLKEVLRRRQAVAIGIAAAGVALLAIGEWQTLWISLALAISFAFYGLVRKLTPVPSTSGLAVETLVLCAPALALVSFYAAQGTLAFGEDRWVTLGLIGTGALTSIPLILFAISARALPLVTLGLMQYIAPSLQFLCGVFLFGEPMSAGRWGSFLLIWVALALFVWDSLSGARARRRTLA